MDGERKWSIGLQNLANSSPGRATSNAPGSQVVGHAIIVVLYHSLSYQPTRKRKQHRNGADPGFLLMNRLRSQVLHTDIRPAIEYQSPLLPMSPILRSWWYQAAPAPSSPGVLAVIGSRRLLFHFSLPVKFQVRWLAGVIQKDVLWSYYCIIAHACKGKSGAWWQHTNIPAEV